MCDEHTGKELVNKTFKLSVEYLRLLLFSRSEFNTKFWAFRKLENVKMSEWSDNKQQMEYTINLGAFGHAKNFEEIVSFYILI